MIPLSQTIAALYAAPPGEGEFLAGVAEALHSDWAAAFADTGDGFELFASTAPADAPRPVWLREAPGGLCFCDGDYRYAVVSEGADATGRWALAVCRRRDAPDYQEADIRLLASLLRHLARARRWRAATASAERERRRRSRALDLIALGVAVVDENGAVAYENATAAQLRKAHGWTAWAYRRFLASGVGLVRPERGAPILIKATTPGAIDLSTSPESVLLMKPLVDVGRAPSALGRLAFGLTPAESRVAPFLALGLGVPQTAELLGLSTETVRSHLGRIFTKTGASNQNELVTLFVRWASPLDASAAGPITLDPV